MDSRRHLEPPGFFGGATGGREWHRYRAVFAGATRSLWSDAPVRPASPPSRRMRSLELLGLSSTRAAGMEPSGAGFTWNPMGQPAEWFSHFLIRAPLLLLGQWFLPPSTFAFAWTQAQTLGIAAFGVVVLALVFFLSRPILREDPTARFFAFGMLLAVVPITAGFPHDRLLFCVGIGAAPLLAMLLARLFDRSELEAPPEPSPDPSPDPRWVLDFDGKNDVVLAEPFVAPEGTHFSVTLWLRADRFQDHQTLLALYPQQKTSPIGLELGASTP